MCSFILFQENFPELQFLVFVFHCFKDLMLDILCLYPVSLIFSQILLLLLFFKVFIIFFFSNFNFHQATCAVFTCSHVPSSLVLISKTNFLLLIILSYIVSPHFCFLNFHLDLCGSYIYCHFIYFLYLNVCKDVFPFHFFLYSYHNFAWYFEHYSFLLLTSTAD